MAEGVLGAIAGAIKDAKKPSKPSAPAPKSKPAGFYSGASYKMAHAAIPPISPVKAPDIDKPKADVEEPKESARTEQGPTGSQDA